MNDLKKYVLDPEFNRSDLGIDQLMLPAKGDP